MKAILVIDEMPTMCIICPCFKYQMDDTGICCADVNDERAYGLDMKSKPNWCPLRPMPKRAFIDQGVPFNEGWNACLDALGETE